MVYPENSCGSHQWGRNKDGNDKCDTEAYDPMDEALMKDGDS